MSSPSSSGSTESATNEERASQELLERLRAVTLGEYDVLGQLGRGGMATVFLAHEISLDRKVAIKVMNPAMVHGTGMVERFKREARTAANLSHPHIIPIYAVREVDGLLFIVIKLVQGTALDIVMKELGQLPIAMIHGILAQVGSALGYAHRHGVVHRDIKPGNILIDDEGWAVVTDFGIAKVADAEIRVTSTGMAIGTPAYMSPEQASADVITGASDQYSLGIVAYEMLTGKPPFAGTSTMAIMYSHFHDEPAPIRPQRPDCPDQLCDAVMRMLRKTPTERWPSVEAAIIAAGSQPLAPDDPTRTQLIELARTGLTHRLVVQTTTPRSPIPKLKTAKKPRAWSRHPVMLGAGGVGLVAAGFFAAKMLTAPAPVAGDPAATPTPLVNAPADSVPVAQPPSDSVRPAPPISSGRASSTASQTQRPERVLPPPPAGRQSVPADPRATVPAADPPRTVPRPDSSGAPAQKAESTTPPPVVAAPPVSASSNASGQTSPTTIVRPADPQAEVTGVIQSYARALAARNLEEARRIYPTMPNDQRQGLEALWRAGGGMGPNWTVSEIRIDGDVATARVRGENVVVPGANQTPQRVPVSLRARLERRNNEWRLVALVN